jgi:hypothetical protein
MASLISPRQLINRLINVEGGAVLGHRSVVDLVVGSVDRGCTGQAHGSRYRPSRPRVVAYRASEPGDRSTPRSTRVGAVGRHRPPDRRGSAWRAYPVPIGGGQGSP